MSFTPRWRFDHRACREAPPYVADRETWWHAGQGTNYVVGQKAAHDAARTTLKEGGSVANHYPVDFNADYPKRSSRGWAILTILLIEFLVLTPHLIARSQLDLLDRPVRSHGSAGDGPRSRAQPTSCVASVAVVHA